uniref:Uncharacterized protein n=1 Tax=uncultured bacterium esnapd17 TaxID=1366598 RepID=S5TLH7_9BACT|nr:hypothetical protein [uncultured bacterium esnapd17]
MPVEHRYKSNSEMLEELRPMEVTLSTTMSERDTRQRVHEYFTVDLSGHLDNIGLTMPDQLAAGALNVWGNSLPAGALPAGAVEVGGVPFVTAGGDGSRPDNVRCAGQLLDLPPVAGSWLHVLATSERRCEEELHVHYADGAVDPEWLRVSDFWPAAAHFGEVAAARTGAMHYPHHIQGDLGGQIWATRVPATRGGTLAALRLPDNPALHLFALTVETVR